MEFSGNWTGCLSREWVPCHQKNAKKTGLTTWQCYSVQTPTAHQLTGQQIKRWDIRASTSDFIQKVSRLRRWWTSVPKNHLDWVQIQSSFVLKGGGDVVGCCKLPGTRILCACSCPCKSGHDVPVSCPQDNVIPCSATFYPYVNGKVWYL